MYLGIGAIIFLMGVGIWKIATSSYYIDKLEETSNCIVEVAGDYYYQGNPYSQDAWNMFIADCDPNIR